MGVVRRRAAVRGGRDRRADRGRDGDGEEGGGRRRAPAEGDGGAVAAAWGKSAEWERGSSEIGRAHV